MPKPTRPLIVVIIAIVVVAALVTVVLHRPAKSVAAGDTTTTVACQSPRFSNDYQINQCLESHMRSMTRKMTSSLRVESAYLRYASHAQDWRVAQHTQATYVAYAREECLSQANPYQSGTIVPIIYGECIVQLFQQRLDTIDRALASFRHGGESQQNS